jgi:hypothetical protein
MAGQVAASARAARRDPSPPFPSGPQRDRAPRAIRVRARDARPGGGQRDAAGGGAAGGRGAAAAGERCGGGGGGGGRSNPFPQPLPHPLRPLPPLQFADPTLVAPSPTTTACNAAVPPTTRARLLWLARSAVAAGMYVILDNHLSTDTTLTDDEGVWVAEWKALAADLAADSLLKGTVLLDLANEPDMRGLGWAPRPGGKPGMADTYLAAMDAIDAVGGRGREGGGSGGGARACARRPPSTPPPPPSLRSTPPPSTSSKAAANSAPWP